MADKQTPAAPPICKENLEYVTQEIWVMWRFALSAGLSIQPDLGEKIEAHCRDSGPDDEPPGLVPALEIHSRLGALIAPRTAVSLRQTEPAAGGLTIRNPVMRMVTFLTCLSLLAYMLIEILAAYFSQSSELSKWFGYLGQLNILPAAVIGAGFFSLRSGNQYIRERTFDPSYNQVYVNRFILGIISGGVLGYMGSRLLQGDVVESFGPDVLALVGGFAADAVAEILQRISETLVTLVRGGDSAKAAGARAEQVVERSEIRSKLAEIKSTPDADKDSKIDELMQVLAAKKK